MNDEDIPTTALNPWHPMSDPVDLKHMGKIAEEAGELASAASRCIIQGIDEQDPTSKKTNREWLEDEIADVMANMRLVEEHFKLNTSRIDVRVTRKFHALKQWHGMA